LVKHVDAAEVRIVVAAVLAAAANAVLIADNLPKICAYLFTARPVDEIA
jgi:hypothetical protein